MVNEVGLDKPQQLTPELIGDFQCSLEDKGLARSSIRTRMMALNGIFSGLVIGSLMLDNPVKYACVSKRAPAENKWP